MAILPTAHATQRFGSRAIDFYVAPGQVIGSDPRARADERRIQDLDGERHPVRIGRREFALEAGDYAAVIRVQPGPKRRSRPVAVVNYRTNSWTRTHQDNTSLLARAGISRNVNWLLAVLAMAALALLVVWPQIKTLLGLVAPGIASALPGFDVFAALVSVQPGLAEARLSDSVPGLTETLTSLAPQLSGQEGMVMFAALVAAGALIAFAARSWRFAWMPVFLVLTLAAAVAVGGPEAAAMPAVLALGGSIALFILGGLVNRWRDAARLEARIARLADHVLRHPPQEMVTRREIPASLSADAVENTSADEGDMTAVPALAPIAGAAISARTGGHGNEDGTVTAEDAPAAVTELDETAPASDEAHDAEGIPAGDVSAAGRTTGEAAGDPRAEARLMDIPPPPPMPAEQAAVEAEPANAGQGGEADSSEPDAAPEVDSAGQPELASEDARPQTLDEDTLTADTTEEVDPVGAGDAYVSQDGPEPRQP